MSETYEFRGPPLRDQVAVGIYGAVETVGVTKNSIGRKLTFTEID